MRPASVATATLYRAHMEPGERMLLPCRGGPSIGRAERFPPSPEIAVDGGIYVLVDDGPPEAWSYEFVPDVG